MKKHTFILFITLFTMFVGCNKYAKYTLMTQNRIKEIQENKEIPDTIKVRLISGEIRRDEGIKPRIINGERVYKQSCSPCHGSKHQGNSKNGVPSFTQKQLDAYHASHIIADGKNKMPSFAEKLTPDEINDVIYYLTQFSRKE